MNSTVVDDDNASISTLGIDYEEENSRTRNTTTSMKLHEKMSSKLTQSMKTNIGAISTTSSIEKRPLMIRNDSQSTLLSTAPVLTEEMLQAGRRLTGPNVQRLIPRFPMRSKLDRSNNIFEARAVGIGAAQVILYWYLLLLLCYMTILICTVNFYKCILSSPLLSLFLLFLLLL